MQWKWIVLGLLLWPLPALGAQAPVSDETYACLDCHAVIQPGLVADWRNSRHAAVTPFEAMQKNPLSRRMSNNRVPEASLNVAVGCAECHLRRPAAHADTFEHNGYAVHLVVSPADCAACHRTEVEQYSRNLMSHARGNLIGNPLFTDLERTISGAMMPADPRHDFKAPDEETRAETCFYCHGTQLRATGTVIRDTDLAGELEFPVIDGWPNQGVGRINLDGSQGACTPCHTRHAFSVETARKPYTCKECHIGPDVPVYKVYAASKHGNLFESTKADWHFDRMPWTVGRDFTAPTCAACHISLLATPDEDVIVPRSHQMNDRLPWRLFGLIYAHPYPSHPDTSRIRNSQGAPLPTDFDGHPAAPYLIDAAEQEKRTNAFKSICLTCHATGWTNAFWKRFENAIETTNAATLTATRILSDMWSAGCIDTGSRFDEMPEKWWQDIWLFYANTARFAAAMGGGGDYGVFANGRYQLNRRLVELEHLRRRCRGTDGSP